MAINEDTYVGPSFSWRNRLGRALWQLAWWSLCRWTPAPFHRWRNVILALFGARLGKGTHIYPGARIWAPWNLVCGREVGVANGATLYNQASITLGTRSVISQGANLCTGSHDYGSPGFELFARPITIGDHAWLAAECFIHPGVTIGEGAVIGARSVVTEDMPAWTVCAGHPCKPLKPRVMKNP